MGYFVTRSWDYQLIFYFQLKTINNVTNGGIDKVATIAGHSIDPKNAELLKSDNSFFMLPNSTSKYLSNQDQIGAIGHKNESANSSGKYSIQ